MATRRRRKRGTTTKRRTTKAGLTPAKKKAVRKHMSALKRLLKVR
jgi:hypothetical protein